MSLLVRPAVADDEVFITTSWLETYRGSNFAKALHLLSKSQWLERYVGLLDDSRNPSLYYGLQRRLVEALVADCELLVACDPLDPSVISGWICYEPKLLHYVCVKPHLQGHGVGSRLMEEAFGASVWESVLAYSHATDDFESRLRKGQEDWRYEPSLAR